MLKDHRLIQPQGQIVIRILCRQDHNHFQTLHSLLRYVHPLQVYVQLLPSHELNRPALSFLFHLPFSFPLWYTRYPKKHRSVELRSGQLDIYMPFRIHHSSLLLLYVFLPSFDQQLFCPCQLHFDKC